MLVKGIASFPKIFTPTIPKGSNEAKYSIALLLPPNDPQIAAINAEIDAAKLNTFPQGLPRGARLCFKSYDEAFRDADYYDARFSGWHVLTATAKEDDRPSVVDANLQPIIDPSQVYAGCEVYVNLGISGYVKGTGGVGGWLNAVMLIGEGPYGRLDGKPTIDQMFAGVAGGAAPAPAVPATPQPAAPAQANFMGGAPAPAAPAPAAPVAPPPVPPAAPAAPQLVMTAAAGGVTLEAYLQAGWTEDQLISNGLAIRQ